MKKGFFLPGIICILLNTGYMVAQQMPYGGTPAAVPGTIEAEDYDTGGEGVAYHDTDTNNSGGGYRPDEGVDLEECSLGGFNVGWIEPDEWIEYTVNVGSTGAYTFEFSVASASTGGSFHFEFDNINVTNTVSLDATGGWQEYITVTVTDVALTAGEHILKFVAESAGFNINSVNIKIQKELHLPTVVLTSPLNNSEYIYGENIPLSATASDSDGTINRVEFYADDVKVAEDNTEPYEVTWQNPPIDIYNIVAKAIDNDGAIGISDIADVMVKYPVFADTLVFSHQRGFYSSTFSLQITTGLAGAQIKYTMDGSNPASSSSAQTGSSPVTLTINPDDATNRGGTTPGVVVRAIAWNDARQQSRVATHTYMFVDKVKDQGHPGGDWPDSGVNGQYWYYDMNQEVVTNSQYEDYIDDALLDIPTISIVSDLGVFFDPDSGIYVNAEYHGIEWERPTSVELINPDGSEGFQTNAGIRIRGGWSRHDGYPKHAFRLFFREKYGTRILKYPLFGDEGVDEFRKMDLRCSQNYSWANIGNGCEFGTYTRDVFSRDVQREMGQPYTRSRYYHLYLNGVYWGLFQTQERPEAKFAESYLGGDDDEYDVVKVDIGDDFSVYELEATDGNMDGWHQVWTKAGAGLSGNDDYFALEGRSSDGTVNSDGKKLVDIENLIDYMLIIFYGGNFDAPMSKFRSNRDPNNFYAIYNRTANNGFIFLAHDSEHTIMEHPFGPGVGIDEDRVNAPFDVSREEKSHPQWLHKQLSANKEYRMRFADHVYNHMYNNGVMTAANLTKLFQDRIDEIDMAIIAESARWGNLTYSKNGTWQTAVDGLVENYFPQRGAIVLDQLKTANLYPDIEPPLFKHDGQTMTIFSLAIANTYELLMENSNGTTGSIKYTLDGTDPRAIGGAVAATAVDGGDSKTITVSNTTVVKARINSGTTWSALHEIVFYGNDAFAGLKITEIHYHPLDEGEVDGREYEFLELKNTGASPISLSLASFIDGIDYSFPSGTLLEKDEIIVLASNRQEFKNRYHFDAFGEYDGQLDNAGERLRMINATGDTIISVRYNDEPPWPWEPDSLGYSLVLTNPAENDDPNDPSSWSVSEKIHGSPGLDDGEEEPVINGLDDISKLPLEYKLYQNYPNPFNPQTTIRFAVKEQANITITIFDILGRVVEKLVDDEFAAGEYQVSWFAGSHAAGLYFYQFKTHTNIVMTRKMILVK
jgi:hypothetical protein